MSSRNDNFLSSFGQEYQKLLSHRRTIGDMNPEQLRDALFQKRMKPEKHESYDEKVRRYSDEILMNMRRFAYRWRAPSTRSSSRSGRGSSTSRRSSADGLVGEAFAKQFTPFPKAPG
ncbi:MAG TPA: hypothetical protein VLK65_13850 [Vicinamibacteria bacterium]|nr:hypothetical protein [Vicinamibacteria bacterium]